ncbi:MAG: response regulator, partial [Candidatus Marinimicrobia bacterium]|nr:response regulator [Candidatus Neomarinimicrobiota bacterium]
AQQNQGHFPAESNRGQGSPFMIYLPRHQTPPAAEPAAAPRAAVHGGRETILVVEDERAVLTICQRCLTDFGYTVLTAESPEQALRLVQEHPGAIDLLLSDMVMPGMNGLALRERLAALRPGLRTLFMTGYTAQDFNADPAADSIPILLKPFSKQALGDKVRELLDAP